MEKVTLRHYGGRVSNLLAQILVARNSSKGDFQYSPDQVINIPAKNFFVHLKDNPLPQLNDDSISPEILKEANLLIGFINTTDDIYNLKRAIHVLLRLGGNTNVVFAGQDYEPERLNMEEAD